MDYSVSYLTDNKIVAIKMRGRLNFGIAEKYSKEALKLAHQNQCAKFLIDHTGTTLQGGLNKIHTSGDELQQFGFKDTDRIAVIISNKGDNSVLLNSINQNSRYSDVKYFISDNIDDAYKWLLESV